VSTKLACKNKIYVTYNNQQARDSCRQRHMYWHLGSWIIYQLTVHLEKDNRKGLNVTAQAIAII
jgi:hypothetical protein